MTFVILKIVHFNSAELLNVSSQLKTKTTSIINKIHSSVPHIILRRKKHASKIGH